MHLHRTRWETARDILCKRGCDKVQGGWFCGWPRKEEQDVVRWTRCTWKLYALGSSARPWPPWAQTLIFSARSGSVLLFPLRHIVSGSAGWPLCITAQQIAATRTSTPRCRSSMSVPCLFTPPLSLIAEPERTSENRFHDSVHPQLRQA